MLSVITTLSILCHHADCCSIRVWCLFSMLGVIMLNVVILNIVAPLKSCKTGEETTIIQQQRFHPRLMGRGEQFCSTSGRLFCPTICWIFVRQSVVLFCSKICWLFCLTVYQIFLFYKLSEILFDSLLNYFERQSLE
jgi:hypothetical protein